MCISSYHAPHTPRSVPYTPPPSLSIQAANGTDFVGEASPTFTASSSQALMAAGGSGRACPSASRRPRPAPAAPALAPRHPLHSRPLQRAKAKHRPPHKSQTWSWSCCPTGPFILSSSSSCGACAPFFPTQATDSTVCHSTVCCSTAASGLTHDAWVLLGSWFCLNCVLVWCACRELFAVYVRHENDHHGLPIEKYLCAFGASHPVCCDATHPVSCVHSMPTLWGGVVYPIGHRY